MSDTRTAAPSIQPAIPVSNDEQRIDSPELARSMQERRRLIEDIRVFNPTAGHAFLSDFTTQALRDYLDHLRHARHKHIRLPGWLERRTAALAEARRQVRRVA